MENHHFKWVNEVFLWAMAEICLCHSHSQGRLDALHLLGNQTHAVPIKILPKKRDQGTPGVPGTASAPRARAISLVASAPKRWSWESWAEKPIFWGST